MHVSKACGSRRAAGPLGVINQRLIRSLDENSTVICFCIEYVKFDPSITLLLKYKRFLAKFLNRGYLIC